MSQAELCVIFNPKAGRQRAAKRLAGLRRSWGAHAEFRPTRCAGDAETLAEHAAREGFRTVAAAGGDGTVHEVANGLLRADRSDVNFAVVPIGSANDYAHSLEAEANGAPPGTVRAVDVGAVSEPTGRQRYFVCCLGLGLNGAVTLESRQIRRLQGIALYGLATLRALWYRYATPRMTLRLDDQPERTMPTLLLSVMLARREGGFTMAPHARLDDGLFDYIHAGALSRFEVLRLLPRLALGSPPTAYPKLHQGQCRRLALRSEAPLTVHIDGEFFARPEDNVRELDIRILPGRLRVQMLG